MSLYALQMISQHVKISAIYLCRQHQAALDPSAMDGGEERASKRLRQETNEQKPVDGVTDFKKGQRDFTPKSDTGTAICADFTSREKEYTNGVIAPTLGRLADWVPLRVYFPFINYKDKINMFIKKIDMKILVDALYLDSCMCVCVSIYLYTYSCISIPPWISICIARIWILLALLLLFPHRFSGVLVPGIDGEATKANSLERWCEFQMWTLAIQKVSTLRNGRTDLLPFCFLLPVAFCCFNSGCSVAWIHSMTATREPWTCGSPFRQVKRQEIAESQRKERVFM